MAITFFNVNSGERKTVDTEPMIAAYYNSSNQHINALVGQDFGWRLAPETIARINDIKSDPVLMDRIAQAFQIPQGEVADTDVVRWISIEDARKETAKLQTEKGNFAKQYEEELKKLESNNTDTETETDSVKINESKSNAKEK